MGLLQEMGYSNVGHYSGGLSGWIESGGRVESAPTRAAAAERPLQPPSRRVNLRGGRWSARFMDVLSERTVGELFEVWLAIVLGCGLVYWSMGSLVGPTASGLLAAMYFSAVTATSIGYGDIVPAGVTRAIAIAEGVAGLVIFGCVVSKFVSRRQEELVAEIHHIAFEDRLGRVRTNLHLVRMELQTTAQLCEGREVAPPDAVARIESVSLVFIGELQAVHDLLYRPQQTPDETVFEAILVSLASVFREFDQLCRCMAMRRSTPSGPLDASLTTMSRLARDICGDCVPRQFAPALRTWMDEIQAIAAQMRSPLKEDPAKTAAPGLEDDGRDV